MYAIYGNIYHQYIPNVSIYIYHTWILWVGIMFTNFANSNGSLTRWSPLCSMSTLGMNICLPAGTQVGRSSVLSWTRVGRWALYRTIVDDSFQWFFFVNIQIYPDISRYPALLFTSKSLVDVGSFFGSSHPFNPIHIGYFMDIPIPKFLGAGSRHIKRHFRRSFFY